MGLCRRLKQGEKGINTIQGALDLFIGYLPEHAVLTIEETSGKLIAKYIFRVQYTSPRSRRTMCIMAKGDTLPEVHDYLFDFYLRQLVMTPQELAREFSHLYFLERRAKQDEFLFGSRNIRVAGKTKHKDEEDGARIEDTLQYEQYI